jgi:hypothetical protein
LNGTMTVRGSGTGTPSYTGHSSPAKDQSMQQGVVVTLGRFERVNHSLSDLRHAALSEGGNHLATSARQPVETCGRQHIADGGCSP